MSIGMIDANRKHPWEQIIEFVRKCPDHRAFKAASREFGLPSKFIRNKLWRNYGLTLEKIREGAEPSPVCKSEVPGKPETKAALEYIVAHPEEKLGEVAGKFGCHPKTLGRLFVAWRRKTGQADGYKDWKRARKPEMEAAVAHMIANPKDGIVAVAVRFGVHRHRLRVALKAQKKVNKAQAEANRIPAVEWAVAHPEMPLSEVGSKFGVRASVLTYWLRRLGVFTPYRRRRINQREQQLKLFAHEEPRPEKIDRNPRLTDAVRYAVAHTDEKYTEIALRFGVTRSGLKTRLMRLGIKQQRVQGMLPSTAKKYMPAILYAAANPSESIKSIAESFSLSASTLGKQTNIYLGYKRPFVARLTPVCRLCGETNPENFSSSSRYRSGCQDKCKTCASDIQKRLWIAKRPQRLAEKYTAEELEAALRMKQGILVESIPLT